MIDLSEIGRDELLKLIEALQLAADAKRRYTNNFYKSLAGPLKKYGELCYDKIKDLTWKDYVEDVYDDVIRFAICTGLDVADYTLKQSDLIDLSRRGTLERRIAGALKDTINKHGPIDFLNVSSASKRIIGVVKQFNRSIRNDNA